MSFDTLGLTPELVSVVADEGYTEPTPVQRQAIPLVLEGRDLLAGAQTGTGKTAAFVLPMLQLLHATGQGYVNPVQGRRPMRPVRALVLTPTRELALQVEESVRTYGRKRPIRSVAIYGGVGFDPQVRAIRAGAEIVVATPGRLLDHVGQRTIDLSAVEILVLDEADRMLDMGFIRDIRRILAVLPPRRQNLLFSATFSDDIRTLANGLLDNPAMVDVAPRNTAAELVDQVVIHVDRHRKRELLSHLVRSGRIEQALVFTRTKHGANRLAEQLEHDGIRAAAIHGNKSQGQRIRALTGFKGGDVDVLVATDIAARGIDIDALPHVVNYELPMVASDYVHRIGRTGRAGVGGRAVSLVDVDETGMLAEIETLLRHRVQVEAVDGFAVDRSIRPTPASARPGQSRGGQPRGGQPRGGGRPGGRSQDPWSRSAAPRNGGPRPSMISNQGFVAMPGERIARATSESSAATTRGNVPANGQRATPGHRPPAHRQGIPTSRRLEPGEGSMTKRSRREREQRSNEAERTRQIQAAWVASVPPDRARAFALEVEAAHARGPQPKRPDMAPGTMPNPPRPGHEPRVPKETTRSRNGSSR